MRGRRPALAVRGNHVAAKGRIRGRDPLDQEFAALADFRPPATTPGPQEYATHQSGEAAVKIPVIGSLSGVGGIVARLLPHHRTGRAALGESGDVVTDLNVQAWPLNANRPITKNRNTH